MKSLCTYCGAFTETFSTGDPVCGNCLVILFINLEKQTFALLKANEKLVKENAKIGRELCQIKLQQKNPFFKPTILKKDWLKKSNMELEKIVRDNTPENERK